MEFRTPDYHISSPNAQRIQTTGSDGDRERHSTHKPTHGRFLQSLESRAVFSSESLDYIQTSTCSAAASVAPPQVPPRPAVRSRKPPATSSSSMNYGSNPDKAVSSTSYCIDTEYRPPDIVHESSKETLMVP
ncbi:hypothetical protein TgHK011_003169 [Trichoderma gracile]|nr:hypothetical protein TgHK011_003169 [Trichoderma gracile]